MIMAGIYGGHLSHRCSNETSKLWGCFKPAKDPKWNLPCWLCFGEKGDKDCVVCGGYGVVGQLRCPNSANTGTMSHLFSAIVHLQNYGILPCFGAMNDQSAVFVKTLSLFSAYSSAWNTKKKIADEIKSKAMEALKNGR